MNTFLDNLIGALRQAGLEFGAEDLADSLWLAPYLPRSPASTSNVHHPPAELKPLDKPPTPEPKSDTVEKRANTDRESSTVSRPSVDAQLPGIPGREATQDVIRGLPVRLSGAASLPEALAIARALRPLRKRIATTRWSRIDEKRTAERLAVVDIWLPVLLPGRERWLNATIIVDIGASMAIWRSMVNEFRGILQSLGAFRKIEVRRMDTDAPGDSISIFASGQSSIPHDPLDLSDPSGRTFFLIISDCVGRAWWDGRVAKLLEQWGRTNHTAILQILPREMWARTALAAGRTVNLTSPKAVCPNTDLAAFATGKFRRNVKLDTKDLVPIPVLELGAASLATWARDTVAATGAQFSGRLLPTNPAPAPVVDKDHWSQALGEPFLTVASVPARKLANLMAAAPPFNLPLLRVIRESRLSGEATQIHEAEFLLGGLLTAASNSQERVDDPDRVIYDFKTPELRAMLRSAVHVSDAVEVMKLEEVGEYLSRRLGQHHNFSAIMRAPQNYAGQLDLGKTEKLDPVARFTSEMLRWLGGEYTELLSVPTDTKVPDSSRQDYQRLVWFIERISKDNVIFRGSAIAVRLRRQGHDARTYLLTCAHLVHDLDSNENVTRVLTTIQAWRAGTSFVRQEADAVRVFVSPRAIREPLHNRERSPSLDWVLLEFEDETDALYAPAVRLWSGETATGEILACGYSANRQFSRGVVMPTVWNRRIMSKWSDGELTLVGEDLHGEMSGTGLFDAEGGFIGIIQSRHHSTMQIVAISADFIRQRLQEFGFHVVTEGVSDQVEPVVELIKILRDYEFGDVNWREALSRVRPQLTTHIPIPDPIDDEWLIDSLRQLPTFPPNKQGIEPLHEFALLLYQMRQVKVLGEWIDKHVPPETLKAFAETGGSIPDSEQPSDPEISVLVVGSGSDKLSSVVHESAEQVGRWVANRGYGLLTCGRQGVDHVAARAFANSLDRAEPIERWLTHVVRSGTKPIFKRGKIVETNSIRKDHVDAIKRANAVILVGGSGGTGNVAENAVRMRVPVFPLPWTGGDATRFHDHVLENWDEHEWMGMPLDRFEALSNPSEALDIIGEHLQPTLSSPKPMPTPEESHDIARMSFLSSKPRQVPFIRSDEELELIDDIFQRMGPRNLNLDFKADLTWEDFQNWLSSRRPVFVHFCGYSTDGHLAFRTATGEAKYVDPETFADAIGTVSTAPRVIVLNADDTESFAKSLTERFLDCVVIATERVVSDDEAIRFAQDFYGQLADGNSVRQAFLYASQPQPENKNTVAYLMWSNSLDAEQLTVMSGFVDERNETKDRGLDAAIKQSTAALRGTPNPVLIHQAIRSLLAARRETPRDSQSAILLAQLHRTLNELQAAIDVLTLAIDLNANQADSSQETADLLYQRARYHAIVGKKSEGIADLSRSFRLSLSGVDHAGSESDFKSLQGDRRFAVLLENPRPRRVLIVGSFRDLKNPRNAFDEFARYCRDLGAALANAGFGFIVGSYSQDTADHYVLEGIAAAPVPISIIYIRPRFESTRLDPKGAMVTDHIVEQEEFDADWPAVRPLQVAAADIVIAIGGRDGTQQAIAITQRVNKPLISIPAFLGAAGAAWPSVRQSLAKMGIGGPLIERLNYGLDETATVEAVQFCLSGPPPDPSGLLRVDDIRLALLRSDKFRRYEPITGELLLLDNYDELRQHTWLIATRDKVYFLLDDEDTREKDRLVQWEINRNTLLPLSIDTSRHTVGFGSHTRPRWYYSPALFPTPNELKAAVESLVASAGDFPLQS